MASSLARPSEAQLAWQQMELGLFIHWFPMGWYQEIDSARLLDPAYQEELLARCTCETLDTDQWAQSAADLGAKYLVFVAKHALGFCAWQTDEGNFGMRQIPWKNGWGDVVADLAASCRKFGLKLGIYLAADTQVMDIGLMGLARDPNRQAAYSRVYRAWLAELLTRYGEIAEVWFDGSLAIAVGDLLAAHAPKAMVFQSPQATIRWVGQEEGIASDPAWHAVWQADARSGVATQRHGDPEGDTWLPLECDARLRRDWGYHANLNDNPLKSLDALMAMYYGSVGRGAVLLINQAPHPQGHILPQDMARMKEFGEEIRRRFAKPLATAGGRGREITLDLGGERLLDHVLLQEDIRLGQRVRAYRVDARRRGIWQPLCAGSAVGYKKIDWFSAVAADALRFTALETACEPVLSTFAAFYAGVIPKPAVPLEPAWEKVGEWGTERYDICDFTARLAFNLSPYIRDAGQYLLRFVPAPGAEALLVSEVQIIIDGIPQPGFLSPANEALTYRLYVPGLGGGIVLWALSRYPHTPRLRAEVHLKRLL